jgi:sigma-B regulation protein RsbU (phosphoserine phosphatase)
MISFLNISAALLIINTSYNTFYSHQRLRLLFYAVAFIIYSFIGVLKIFFYNPEFFNVSQESILRFQIYYDVVYTVFLIILLIGSFISLDKTVKDKSYSLSVITPMSILLGVLGSSIFIPVYLLDLKYNWMALMIITHVNFIISILIIAKYNITNSRIHDKYFMRFLLGFTLLFITRSLSSFDVFNESFDLLVLETGTLIGLFTMAHSIFRYNIAIPFKQLVLAKKQIDEYTHTLEEIVRKRTTDLEIQNNYLQKEIEYAKGIQQSLLPSKNYKYENASFVSEYYPCEKLSGDFYDIYAIDDTHIGMYILDVSGHGISAALMTMFCNNFVRSTEKLINRYRGLKPHRNLQHFFDEFNKTNFPCEMHMVILFASLDLKSGMLTYSNGGITNYPIILRSDGKVEFLDKNEGFPICKTNEFFVPEYYSSTVTLKKGDKVIFFTDGLVDDIKNGIMNEDELIDLFKVHSNKNLSELNELIKHKIEKRLYYLKDDVTYFILEYS